MLDKFANEIAPGDHIRKTMYMEVMENVDPVEYYHDGLFIDGDLVIHYSGNAGQGSTGKVEVVSLEKFGDQCQIEVVPHPNRRFSSADSIRRAISRYQENSYSLASNNCQHFVNWCIEGEHRSEQVDVALSVVPTAYRKVAEAILKMFGC